MTLADQNSELREELTNTKRELQKSINKQNELKNRLTHTEDKLKEKEEFYENNKNKNWDENQRALQSLRRKCTQLQE